jgi:hypothetical protein
LHALAVGLMTRFTLDARTYLAERRTIGADGQGVATGPPGDAGPL